MNFKKKNEKTFYADDPVEVNPRDLQPKVSKIGYDESEKIFWTTVDRISFKSIYDVVEEVLQAHQYVANFENILACLDQTGVGIRALTKNDQIDRFNYILYFKMPQKNRKGSLLNMFYEEISIYEKAILMSKSKIEKKQPDSSLEDLTKENQQLKQVIAKLTQKKSANVDTWSAHPTDSAASASFKFAKVQNIRLSQRQITVKIGQKSLQHPTSGLTSLPQTGQNCLAYYQDGQVKDVWFMESNIHVEQSSAAVLFKERRLIKVRDLQRRTHVIHATNEEEKKLFDRLQRGSLLQIGLYKNTVTYLQELRQQPARNHADMIQEKIATCQLDLIIEEASDQGKELRKAS